MCFTATLVGVPVPFVTTHCSNLLITFRYRNTPKPDQQHRPILFPETIELSKLEIVYPAIYVAHLPCPVSGTNEN